MASEPITVFSNRVDPDGVLELVIGLHPSATVERNEHEWTKITVTWRRGVFRRPLTLELTHSSDYYGGPDWPKQQNGMQFYFSRFPMEGERRRHVMETIMGFRFVVGSIAEPDFLDGADPRIELLSAVAASLQGCWFTPTSLRDSLGRVLIDVDGSFDSDAEFPPSALGDVGASVTASDATEEDSDDEPDPPSADRVARRTLVLAAVAARGLIDLELDRGNQEPADALPRLREWLESLDLVEECEPEEWTCITAPAGSLSERQKIDSCWRLEGLGVLAWALGRFELPRYDTQVDSGDLLPAVGFLKTQEVQALLEHATLRSAEDLDTLAEQVLAFHWRMRDFSLRPAAMDFKEFGNTCWFGPIEMDWAELVERDLALHGLPIAAASAETVSVSTSIAMERHVAINWLRGWSKVYSETDTST